MSGQPTFKNIDVEEANEILENSDVIVVDIRDSDSYEDAHIKGAVSLNQENIENFIVKTDKSKMLLCYCYHGFSSQGISEHLAAQGFKNVYNVEGGFEALRVACSEHVEGQ